MEPRWQAFGIRPVNFLKVEVNEPVALNPSAKPTSVIDTDGFVSGIFA
jgi:hypothetical protein